MDQDLRSNAKELVETLLIEAYDHLVADEDYRDAHLTALVDHLLALLHVGCDIELGVGNIVCLEVLLAHLAEVAGWGGVDGDSLIHTIVFMLLVYQFQTSAGTGNRTPISTLGRSHSTTKLYPLCLPDSEEPEESLVPRKMRFEPVIFRRYDDDNLFSSLRNAMILTQSGFLSSLR